MELYETGYKLHCRVPLGKALLLSLLYIFLLALSAGLALPFCLFHMGEMLANHTQLAKLDEASGD